MNAAEVIQIVFTRDLFVTESAISSDVISKIIVFVTIGLSSKQIRRNKSIFRRYGYFRVAKTTERRIGTESIFNARRIGRRTLQRLEEVS